MGPVDQPLHVAADCIHNPTWSSNRNSRSRPPDIDALWGWCIPHPSPGLDHCITSVQSFIGGFCEMLSEDLLRCCIWREWGIHAGGFPFFLQAANCCALLACPVKLGNHSSNSSRMEERACISYPSLFPRGMWLVVSVSRNAHSLLLMRGPTIWRCLFFLSLGHLKYIFVAYPPILLWSWVLRHGALALTLKARQDEIYRQLILILILILRCRLCFILMFLKATSSYLPSADFNSRSHLTFQALFHLNGFQGHQLLWWSRNRYSGRG